MFAIIDIETTGLDPKKDKITEIAILIHDGLSVVDEYSTLINPERSIPHYISGITGITNQMVLDAPKFYEVAKKILEMTRDCVFVAHNVEFDFGFVAAEYKSLGYVYKREKLCTVKLSRKLLPRRASYSLGNLCRALGISLQKHHRALDDATATAQLFGYLLQLKNEDPRYRHQDLEALNTGRLQKIQQYILQKLPEATGVYYFLNREQEVIYIGKSINIRQRAIQHFNSKDKKTRQMLNEMFNVRYEETGGELISLLLEAEEIKKYQPKFNRSLRRDLFHYTIESFTDEQGVINLRITEGEKAKNPLLFFHTWLSARTKLNDWIDQYRLCPKYCGMYDQEGPCFNFQIRKCDGVCCGNEVVEKYNEKVMNRIQKYLPDMKTQVIEQAGRTSVEKSFVLIINNRFSGYGYVHKEYELSSTEEMRKRVVPFTHYPDMDELVRNYIIRENIKPDTPHN